jgi:hypothetical protein
MAVAEVGAHPFAQRGGPVGADGARAAPLAAAIRGACLLARDFAPVREDDAERLARTGDALDELPARHVQGDCDGGALGPGRLLPAGVHPGAGKTAPGVGVDADPAPRGGLGSARRIGDERFCARPRRAADDERICHAAQPSTARLPLMTGTTGMVRASATNPDEPRARAPEMAARRNCQTDVLDKSLTRV